MTKFTVLNNKAELNSLRDELNAVLKKFEEQNVRIRVGSISYNLDGLSASLKVEANIMSKDGQAVDPGAEAFKKYASIFGLKESDYGRKFKTFRDSFVLTGLAPKNPKFPVLARSKTDGKTYKFPEKVVLELIRKTA